MTARAWAAVTLAGALVSSPALAQSDASAAQIGAAREVGIEGLKLAEEGRCAEAIEKLARAESLYSAPTTLGRLGECRVKVGKLVLGTENLQRVVKMTLAPNAPPAFRLAQDRAQKVLDEALPRLGRLRVAVAGAPGSSLEMKLDGEPLAGALLGVDMPVDPGSHRLEVKAAGFLPGSRTVDVPEGGRESVSMTLQADPNAVAPPAAATATGPVASTAPTTTSPPPTESSPTRRYVSYGLLGVGAAGLIVGGVFGLLAVGRKGDLDEQCQNKVCNIQADSDYERARSAGTVSTIGFGVGVVSAGVGLVLLLTGGSSSSSARSPRALTLGAGPAPAGLGLSGAF